MDYLKTVSIPLITAIVVVVMHLLKIGLKSTKGFNIFKNFIPLISTGLGVILGIIAFFGAPQIISAPNVVIAMLIGGASGLAATGCHQVCKQIKDCKNGNCEKKNCEGEDCKDEPCEGDDCNDKEKDTDKTVDNATEIIIDTLKNL